MGLKKYLALLGAILVIAGGMSPMLRIPLIGNWNYWDIDSVLASVVYALAAVALLGAVLQKSFLVKFSGWAILIVVLFTLVAVYFKVNDYFSFIPFKKLARIGSNMVHYKWTGWLMLLAGAVVMIFRPLNDKKIN
jgi:hypothetical protein